jgi:UDP-N-acetylmuramoyl-tripeptide--D-alanyl-D-alanine ligase
MNHAGEIVPLSAMVRPHVAVVTTIEPVHIEYFRSILGIVDAKGEIFSGLVPGGAAVIGRDGPYFERLRAHAQASAAGRIVTFGESEGADVRAERIILKPDLSVVEARIFGKTVAYRIGTPGRHIALNSLAVLAAASALGCDVAAVASGLSDLKPPVGRGERTILDLGRGQALLIDESYNANPASVRAALATLAAVELPAGARRIAVLGDMRELGSEAGALHRDLAAPIEESNVDLVFTAGDLMRNLVSALPPARRGAHSDEAAGLVEAVVSAIGPGDAVMIKGSNSMRMAQIVAALKERFGPGARKALKG